MTDDLVARFGSARRPDRPPIHPRPDDVSEATVHAVGQLSAALEVVDNARGFLYGFHRMIGEADAALQEALDALAGAGHAELAEEISEVLVGRDVVVGRGIGDGAWTFQLVESFDRDYWTVFRAAREKAEGLLTAGRSHVYEAGMKVSEQTKRTLDSEPSGKESA